jgi:hypothetical protein
VQLRSGRTWQIELDITKPMSLNHRQHHMVQAKMKAELRASVGELLQLAEHARHLEHCLTTDRITRPRTTGCATRSTSSRR